jgi:hypothetical protein
MEGEYAAADPSYQHQAYACCRLFHSLIDGLREVSQGFNLPDKDHRNACGAGLHANCRLGGARYSRACAAQRLVDCGRHES